MVAFGARTIPNQPMVIMPNTTFDPDARNSSARVTVSVRPPEKRQMYVSMNAHPLTVIIIVGTLMVTPV